MTYSLASLHTDAIAMAGPNFTWDGIDGTSRPRTDAFPGLVAFLSLAQGGACAACGEALGDEPTQVCHIVASRNQRGYVAGNLYAGHQGCNIEDRDKYGDVVPLSSLVLADMVATTYPTRADMLALADRSATRARRAAKRQA